MKKTITTLLFSGLALISFSQVTLQASDLNPVVGDLYQVYAADYVNPGGTGSNVTWDLSSMQASGSTTSQEYLAPSGTHPSSNIRLVSGTGPQSVTAHMSTSANNQTYVATDGGGVTIDYSDPMQLMVFPASLGLNETDNFAASFTSQSIPFNRAGTTTVECDGWGTLITPEGTFNDVIRIVITAVYTDTYQGGTIDYTTVTYAWHKAGFHYALASVSEVTTSVSPTTQFSGQYMQVDNVGINELPNSLVSIFPNPTKGIVHIEMDNFKNVSVANALGQVVLTSDQQQIDMSAFEGGIYSLLVEDVNGNVSSQRLVLNQ